MILYGSMLSPFVRKVLVLADEKGMTLELKPVAPGSTDPGFRAASPLGKMPGLVDGDFRLADSSAICVYLDAVGPGPTLIPDAPQAKARTIWWDEFGDTELFACGREMFFNRVVAPLFQGRPGDQAAADRAEAERLPPLMAYLEGTVPDAGYLVGAGLTLADIAVASPFVNLRHAGVTVDPARHPRTAAYVERILTRPSFAAWIGKETGMVARARAR